MVPRKVPFLIAPFYRTVGAIVVASFFIAFTTVMAKGLAGRFEAEQALHPMQVSFGRFFFAALVWSTLWVLTRQKFERVNWQLHAGRVIFGYATSLGIFWASSLMVLADATAISFLSPAVTLVLAMLFLGERVRWVRWSAVAIMILGSLILLRPGTSAFQPAALIALAAALVGGGEAIFIKLLTRKERLIQILFLNNLIGLVLATALASLVWVWPGPVQWAQLASVGFGMAVAQALFTWGMSRADASVIMPFIYSSLLFATVMDFWLFGDLPNFWAAVGAVTIVIGGAFLALREAMNQRRQDAPAASPSSAKRGL